MSKLWDKYEIRKGFSIEERKVVWLYLLHDKSKSLGGPLYKSGSSPAVLNHKEALEYISADEERKDSEPPLPISDTINPSKPNFSMFSKYKSATMSASSSSLTSVDSNMSPKTISFLKGASSFVSMSFGATNKAASSSSEDIMGSPKTPTVMSRAASEDHLDEFAFDEEEEEKLSQLFIIESTKVIEEAGKSPTLSTRNLSLGGSDAGSVDSINMDSLDALDLRRDDRNSYLQLSEDLRALKEKILSDVMSKSDILTGLKETSLLPHLLSIILLVCGNLDGEFVFLRILKQRKFFLYTSATEKKCVLACLDYFIAKTYKLKSANALFISLNLRPSSFFEEYFDTFFTSLLTYDKLLRVIDCLLAEGFLVLLRVALTTLKLVVKDINHKSKATMKDKADFQLYYINFLKEIKEEELIKSVFQKKLIFQDEWENLINQYYWIASILPHCTVFPSDIEDSSFHEDTHSLSLVDSLWVGFDLDHTLVPYNNGNIDSLLYAATIKRLVSLKQCRIVESDGDEVYGKLAARGLVIDCLLGNVIQLDSHKVVRRAYHGSQLLLPREICKLYENGKADTYPENNDRFTTIHIAGARVLVSLVSLCIQRAEDYNSTNPSEKSINYKEICSQVKEAFNFAHSLGCKGGYKDGLKENVKLYTSDQKNVRHWFKEIKHRKEKRLFLITNSDYAHADNLMRNCYGDKWRAFFDIIITRAKKKSGFFGEEKDLVIAPAPKKKSNYFSEVEETDNSEFFTKLDESGASTGAVVELELGGIYFGGNAKLLMENMLKISAIDYASMKINDGVLDVFPSSVSAFAKHILYFGDHVEEDIVNTRRLGWKAGWIAPEIFDISTKHAIHSSWLSFYPSKKDQSITNIIASVAETHATLVVPSVEWLAKVLDKSKSWHLSYKNCIQADFAPSTSNGMKDSLRSLKSQGHLFQNPPTMKKKEKDKLKEGASTSKSPLPASP